MANTNEQPIMPLDVPVYHENKDGTKTYARIVAAMADRRNLGTQLNLWSILVACPGKPLQWNNPEYWLVWDDVSPQVVVTPIDDWDPRVQDTA